MAPPIKFRLGEALVQRGLITDEQLGAALAHQKLTGRRLGRALMDLKLVTDEDIGRVISDQMRIPFVHLNEQDLDPALVRRLPEAQARRLRAIVLGEQELGLQVGLVDPTDMLAYDQVCRALNTAVYPVVVTEDALLATIERVYQRREEIIGLAKEVAADIASAGISLTTIDVAATAEDAPIVRLLQSVFDAAVTRDVSDIHIEPQEGNLTIRFRLDGSMQVQSTSSSKITSAVVQRLKLMASLDISERRLPQDGRFQIKVNNATVDVRISTMPTQYGESVVMRLLPQNTDRIRLDAIGMPAPILTRLRAAISSASGMVLVTGPTGSGKTTTLYSALAEINAVSRKIITVEDPIEYRLPGLNQVQVNEKVGLSFSRVLRACLRQDPDVILVGEMRDQETAEIGLRAALTGHLVLSTLHTLDAAGTPMRLRDMGLAPYMIALGVRLVIAQRLVRTICENCKKPYTPAPHERAWLSLGNESASDAPFFQGVGCGQCNNSGYKGRAGVYELMEMTPELVQLVSRDDPTAFAEAAQKAFADFTLRRHALQLVAEGRTTIAEAMQASNQF
ncbi:MAG: Flp pilus assembly complex ATPase component TadA [Burkholderiales bacterium]|nr:Flp pilus assembly complex ATPase component TadA [Burkholderiales bacterium]